MSDEKPYQLLWAKFEKKGVGIHRLPHHMLDVGLTAEALWTQSLHPALKRKLAQWAGQSVEEMGRVTGFLASLHDLGKASPAFQDHPRVAEERKKPVLEALRRSGLPLPADARGPRTVRHEAISTWALRPSTRPGEGENLLSVLGGLPSSLAGAIAQALGGHHGAWPPPDATAPQTLVRDNLGGAPWTAARRELVQAMWDVFQPPTWRSCVGDTTRDNVALMLLSAIVSAADWIGSDENSFGYVGDVMLPGEYVQAYGRSNAATAVGKAGWKPPDAMPPFHFEEVFQFEPRRIQSETIAKLEEVELPALAIFEAPMGVGKTEVAMAGYADWAQRTGGGGLYMAMPTTATSNQMHDRVTKFLRRQAGATASPLLVHGQALLREVDIPEARADDTDDIGEVAAAQAWFLPRKKSLLAPYGVGTVDQALMAVLQTKHFFVRLLGLSHKVVVFDEVHAYDTYMSELFGRLLQWLRAVDAAVIVLSATLTDATRRQLVSAYAGTPAELPNCDYPRLTIAAADRVLPPIALQAQETRTLHYAWLPPDEGSAVETEARHIEPDDAGVASVLNRLRAALRARCCAAVICNTVGRAQQLYQALRDLEEPFCSPDDLILFHARFPLAWRQEIEEQVLAKFGPGDDKARPNPRRPERAIVVATQVVEQSLDLDFDVMISELAPVDLLLQRAGRLRRHQVNDPARSEHPDHLWIVEPPEVGGVPQLAAGDAKVYEPYVLLRTWLALRSRPSREIVIPRDVTEVIEAVYGVSELDPGTEAMARALRRSGVRREEHDRRAEAIAHERLVREPSYKRLLRQPSMSLGDEDDPELNAAFRVLTRLSDPGVQVVCLHRVNGRVRLEPTPESPVVEPEANLDKKSVLALLRRSLTIRHFDPEVEQALLKLEHDPEIRAFLRMWKGNAALRYHRAVILTDGQCRLPGTSYVLQLNRSLGLILAKEG